MSDIEIQTTAEAKEEAGRHSSDATEIVLTDELLAALVGGAVLYVQANDDNPIFVTLKPFL